MKTPLVVIGGGGHARVIIDAANSSGEFRVLGFLDPAGCDETRAMLQVDRLGGDEAAAHLVATAEDLQFALGVGAVGPSPQRRAIVDRYDRLGAKWAIVVHGGATVASTASMGPGAVVLAGAIVGPGAAIGRHVIVNSGAIVEHDVELGEHVVLGPGVVLGGGASVGPGAFVGLGALVRDHVRIGSDATVAMGAVVVDHVPTMAVVAGTPARPMGPG